MIRIDKLPPGVPSCVAIPFVTSDDEGFVDTRMQTQRLDQPIILSHTALVEANKLFGIPTKELWEEMAEKVVEQAKEIAQLEEQLKEADRQLAAIELLESEGYRKRKRVGRPPKKEPANA